MNDYRQGIVARSHGRCEGMFFVKRRRIWARCPEPASQIHHLITRARGGKHLDAVGEYYHLIHLCLECHKAAHEGGEESYWGGLLIDGYVTLGVRDRPVYVGTDTYLKEKYAPKGAQPRSSHGES